MNRKYFTPKHLDGLMADLMLKTTEREIRDVEETADYDPREFDSLFRDDERDQ
jgi:hypothetical protein